MRVACRIPPLCGARPALRFASFAPGASAERRHRVFFLGSGAGGERSLERLLDASARGLGGGFDVVLAATHPPTRGRGGKASAEIPSPVANVAGAAGVPVLTSDSRSDDFMRALRAAQPDLAITAAYGQLLTQAFLDVPRCGTLNIHPSLLPKWRGAAPLQRALAAGDACVGVTVARTVLKLDAGPVLAQRAHALAGDEMAPELLVELFDSGTGLLVAALDGVWDGCADWTEQADIGDGVPSKASKVRKDEARLCFGTLSAREAHNMVRAFRGWPDAWTEVERPGAKNGVRQRLKVLRTRRVPGGGAPGGGAAGGSATRAVGALGALHDTGNGEPAALRVMCAGGEELDILEVQPAGKSRMAAAAFCNGLLSSTSGTPAQWLRLAQANSA